MKDIDFDELDKAVNSLMATAKPDSGEVAAGDVKPENTLEVPVQPVTTAPTPSVPVTEPSVQSVAVTPTPTPTVAPAPLAPAVKRTGGRFMDMVHASSDMNPRAVTTPPPSREGLSITPRSEPAPTTPAVPVEEKKSPETMPDPIDIALPEDETVPVEPAVPAEPASPEVTPVGESPFIADAKVEKRPLNPGISASETFDAQLANELAAEAAAIPKEDAPAVEASTDEPPVTPQIPELSSDLVAIESSEKIEDSTAAQATDTSDAANAIEAPAAPLGATSIAKQYKSQPSTGDQSHAAIYDASQYPEPVAHPAKKKSGWLWVLWVVLLLAVGAGVAVGLYFFGIIP